VEIEKGGKDMSSISQTEILTLSDLENAVAAGDVQRAQHAFDKSNQGVGDAPRLEMLIPKLGSLKEAPGKSSHSSEIDALIEGIRTRIKYLKEKS
tara:strand:+ start:9401 stop:9685 length:285 start_codon:yes stop_codon:yes gene_type:complete